MATITRPAPIKMIFRRPQISSVAFASLRYLPSFTTLKGKSRQAALL
jgi:hypothetical protein